MIYIVLEEKRKMSKKIVIVGGVAGGASTATRLRRLSEEYEIIMFEKGPYPSFANCGLPYHIGNIIPERESLIVQTPEKFKSRFQIDVRTLSEVIAVNTKEKRYKYEYRMESYMKKVMMFLYYLQEQRHGKQKLKEYTLTIFFL